LQDAHTGLVLAALVLLGGSNALATGVVQRDR